MDVQEVPPGHEEELYWAVTMHCYRLPREVVLNISFAGDIQQPSGHRCTSCALCSRMALLEQRGWTRWLTVPFQPYLFSDCVSINFYFYLLSPTFPTSRFSKTSAKAHDYMTKQQVCPCVSFLPQREARSHRPGTKKNFSLSPPPHTPSLPTLLLIYWWLLKGLIRKMWAGVGTSKNNRHFHIWPLSPAAELTNWMSSANRSCRWYEVHY